ncbi:GAS2 domain protein [Aspergillus novofumigatus IBT 16806]|uniref:GAS2 domain protein n=1 Tax=Aspergillus novofumigatus (strain IBT 16806) TaxID=1392255 RepID=A0A2I1CE85_ASPN1|nr:GAS2 domain protein [Aspergillus novofumigatus IBT 16806]PKX95908.1 GAS2 domain protein [Aspergillus novofumigatus IBT 16806]
MATSRVSPVRPSVRFSPTESHHYRKRSLSRSPDRSAAPKYETIDPLLSNLSPESTLLALTSTDAVPKNEKAAHDILWKSISQVSPAERALGIRAAIAAQKLGEWYREVQAWDWPKRADAELGKGFMPPCSSSIDSEEQVYYGSLPSVVVKQHEDRIEEIRDGMETLDVDELKEHVLNAHIPARSRPSSSNSTVSVPPPLTYVQLSDFTAVITATILRALPLLSRLNSLLTTWDVRLLVLRQIPGLLRALHLAQSEVNSAMDLLKATAPPSENDPLYSRENYHAKRAGLEAIVLSAGRRMDNVIDALEGREDSLPESWIDQLEAVESDFSTWVMEAEKRTVQNEWLRLRTTTSKSKEAHRVQNKQNRLSNIPEEEDSESPVADSSDPFPQSSCSFPMETIDEGDDDQSLVEPISDPVTHNQNSAQVLDTSDPSQSHLDPSESVSLSGPNTDAASKTKEGAELANEPPEQSTIKIVIDAVSPVGADLCQPESSEIFKSFSGDSSDTSIGGSSEEPSNGPLSHSAPRQILPDTSDAVSEEVSFEQTHEDTTVPQTPEQERPASIEQPSGERTDDTTSTEKHQVPCDLQCSLTNDDLIANRPAVDSLSVPSELLPEDTFIVSHVEEKLCGSQLSVSAQQEPSVVTGSAKSTYKEHKNAPVEESSFTSLKNDSFRIPEPETPSLPTTGTSMEPTDAVCGINEHQTSSNTVEDKIQEGRKQFPEGSPVVAVPSDSDRHLSVEPLEDKVAPTVSSNLTEMAFHDETAAAERLTVDRLSRQSLSADTGRAVDPSGSEESSPIENEAATLASVIAEAATTGAPSTSMSLKREESFSRSTTSSPEPAKPMSNSGNDKESPVYPGEPQQASETVPPPKIRLQSPIKLSKTRPQNLYISKGNSKSRARRTSTASAGSLSDYPSLTSSPGIREPRTASSNGTPLLLETPPPFQDFSQASDYVSIGADHTLREERLRRLDNQKVPNATMSHNRALSLPLQRFINEGFDMQYESEAGGDLKGTLGNRRASVASVDLRPQSEQHATDLQSSKDGSTVPTNNLKLLASQHMELSQRRQSTSELDDATPKPPKAWALNTNAFARNSAIPSPPSEPPVRNDTVRIRKQMTTHPSLENIGAYNSNSQPLGDASFPRKGTSRPSTPSKQMRRPKNQLDEKISSILNTIPARIHLVSSGDREFDEASVAPSLPVKYGERFSMTPQGALSRSGTPTPSLTLTAAPSRRRHSHAPEDGSVKLYHLHRGGKAAPTKLFIRTVGEKGERVMVRVGGGWADLAEYLREYAIHHGCRAVSETPRPEVQGLSSRGTPAPSSPGSTLTPTANTGRRTPSRPASVISNRPSSSLAVRKTRRVSNVSDRPDFRSVSAGQALMTSYSPLSTVSSRRRLSMSSTNSFGATSFASENHRATFANSPSIPLGLAGPTPRSRRVSISPESEAWVEDVLGQARRSSSSRPVKYVLPSHEQEPVSARARTLPKSRSISDIGRAGSSRRVALRGLGNPRD